VNKRPAKICHRIENQEISECKWSKVLIKVTRKTALVGEYREAKISPRYRRNNSSSKKGPNNIDLEITAQY